MQSIKLTVGLIFLAASGAAQATVQVLGNSEAANCYRNASNHIITDVVLAECNAAMGSGLSTDDKVATYVNRGIVHMLRMEDKRAESDFKNAIKLDSTEAEAVLNMALLRLRQGNGEEALPLANKALTLKTDRPALAMYTRGIAHEYVGELKQAYADLVEAQKLDPKWPLPAEELKRYQMIGK